MRRPHEGCAKGPSGLNPRPRTPAFRGEFPGAGKRRVAQLIALDETLHGESLRTVRAVEALEYLTTPQARQLLQALAKGALGAWQTREARQSLDGLAKRKAMAAGG